MNREIKFRAWDKRNLEMLYNGLEYQIRVLQIEDTQTYPMDRIPLGFNDNDYSQFNIMQFTGLHDKNGKEIYEGDIVRILYTDWVSNTDPNISLEDYLISISHIGKVIYTAPEWVIEMVNENRFGEKEFGSFYHGKYGRIEIIGNIYQHPELLK